MSQSFRARTAGTLLALLSSLLVLGNPLAAADAKPVPAKIAFVEETLGNGLKVIYAPLKTAPVVHVRVLYHVGSRDERPDRQGFAHLFEHMMFRGSAHVKPEEHMKLIGVVGGNSNAFTSFDQTVYVNTIPSNHLEMALYLEADRMASFKVDETIYKTERKVVAEEWRLRQNQPYGTMYDDFLRTAFTTHPYRWTPIGDMQHLAAAGVAELQDFFNRYYVPNNAILVIAGDIDVEQARGLVKRYFGWIPKGPDVKRDIPAEPEQAQARRAEVKYPVPLPAVLVGYHLPGYRHDDHYPVSLLGTILSGGRSARLDRELVHGKDAVATYADVTYLQLEDMGGIAAGAGLLPGRDVAEAEAALVKVIAGVAENGVTAEELEKAKTQARVGIINGRRTATALADQLGSAALFGQDANRVNTDLAKLEAVTPADIQRVARTYLRPERSTTLVVRPDPLAALAKAGAKKVEAEEKAAEQTAAANPPEPAGQPRVVKFPEGYPERPPVADASLRASFEKGTEATVNGVKVIVMPDHRLPTVNWSLVMRRGSDSDPKGKEGLAGLTAQMLRRGAAGVSFEELNKELESRGITLEAGAGGDVTTLSGSSLSPDLEHGLMRARQVLREPAFPEAEFKKLKDQRVAGLLNSRETPSTVASTDLVAALYGDSPLGRNPTPESVSAITLDDVKAFYARNYRPNDAILVLSGDVTVERGQALAKTLLDGWEPGPMATVSYDLPEMPKRRRIILVDNPAGKQATIRMGARAYTLRSDEKFPGSVAGTILSSGIESRLGRYVRAEKGLAYGVRGTFDPGRHAGAFVASTDTALESTADAVRAVWKVLDDLRREDVAPQELADAQRRVAGGMVMAMQTIQQQAGYRVDGLLNGYPIDYYDTYPSKIAAVTAGQVRAVIDRYARDDEMVVIVVAPAGQVKAQLERLGEVEVVPMPAKREGAKGQQELKKAA